MKRIFVNYTSNRGLIYKIHKELKKSGYYEKQSHNQTYAESKEVFESALSPKWDLFIISPIRSEEAHVEEEVEGMSESEGTDGSKETVTPRLNKLTHILTERLWQHAQSLNSFKPDEIPVLRRESGQGITPLTMKLSVTDTCLQSKNQFFFLVESHRIQQPHFRVGHMPRKYSKTYPFRFNYQRLHYIDINKLLPTNYYFF